MTPGFPDFQDLRDRYVALQPPLEELCRQLTQWLSDATRSAGILEPRIDGRVKEPHSLLSKALRKELENDPWNDPLIDASDKVGVRADLVYTADVETLTAVILNADDMFETPINVDDKLKTELGIDRLGYHGVHFDVVPRQLPDGLSKEVARCEIQLRTNAQAAWSMATHDLVYKAPVEPGDRLRRRVNRLTALLECFDEDVHRTRATMMGRQGYPEAIVLRALEAARMRFPAVVYDRELARDVVSVLLAEDDADRAHEIAREVAEFSEAFHDKLERLFSKVSYGHFMLAQPETVLIFMMLELRPMQLRSRWVAGELPYRLLDDLAGEWGATLPAPL